MDDGDQAGVGDTAASDDMFAETAFAATALGSTALGATALASNVDPSLVSESRWDIGDELLDEFEVERELGRGGMGEVYAVRSTISGKRFAVKRTRLDDALIRRAFLRELRTWLEVPEHPNVVGCRFYRTVGEDIVIFAEFVEGGTVRDWIDTGRVDSVETVLEIAAQTARGLQAAHALDLVHQDIKPENVLMTADGTAKITDFGLAKSAAGSGVVTGMTVAYCSPEQAFRDQPIQQPSDVWSLAVMTVELALGDRLGVEGPMAGRTFAHLTGEEFAFGLPRTVRLMLERCFSPSAEKRPTAGAMAVVLEDAWSRERGVPYPRAAPQVRGRARTLPISTTESGWTSPKVWLPHDSAAVDDTVVQGRASAVADLEKFEEAARFRRSVLQRSVHEDQLTQERVELARLLSAKAKVHIHVGDFDGARVALKEAGELTGSEHPDLQATLLTAHGVLARDTHDYAAALDHFREALAVRQADADGDTFNAIEIGELHRQIGRALWHQREYEQAREACDAALEWLDGLHVEHVVDRQARDKAMVRSKTTLASAYNMSGDHERAREIYAEAVEQATDLVVLDGVSEFRPDVAMSLFNLAFVQRQLGLNAEAVANYERALRMYEQLVRSGQSSFRDNLALTCANLSVATKLLGDLDGALRYSARAIGVRERLVHLEGRRDLEASLATAYLSGASIQHEIGDLDAALELARLGIEIRERLVGDDGREELRPRLANAHGSVATWLQQSGLNERAVPHLRRAIELRETLGDSAKTVAFLVEHLLRLGATDDAGAAAAVARAAKLLAGREDLEISPDANRLVAALIRESST